MSDPYSRDSGILQNTLDIDNPEILDFQERLVSSQRTFEIENGDGPRPTFDRAYLQALHKHIFQDVYPWAGKTRDQTFEIDGHQYAPVNISKGESHFLPLNFINNGLNDAFRPLNDADKLDSVHGFAETAGKVLGELNYVHPFREGNGRTQRAFISSLGRAHGHDVDFTVITAERNIQASIAVNKDPDAPDLKDLLLDATDPVRQDALRTTLSALERDGHNTQELDVRSAKVGETVTGPVFHRDNDIASIVQENGEVLVLDQLDIPEGYKGDPSFTVERDLSNLASPDRLADLQEKQNSQIQTDTNDVFDR